LSRYLGFPDRNGQIRLVRQLRADELRALALSIEVSL
jgi:hypothetical protein